MKGMQRKLPRHSSWLLFLFGFTFIGWSGFDAIMHRRDTMTSVSMFLGLLSLAVAYCVQNIERRLDSIDKELRVSQDDAHKPQELRSNGEKTI